MVYSLTSIDDRLMTYVYFFPLSIMQRSLKSIYLPNIHIFKSKCGDCNVTFYNKAKRHFKVRMWEYFGVSALTDKNANRDNSSAIK